MDIEFIRSVIYDDDKRICAGEKISKQLKEDLIVLCNDCHEKFHDIFY